ncbi:hypothetical protein D3C71_1381190 [compost metagenome]
MPFWLRAARAINLPKATSMRPLPIGNAACTVVVSASSAGLFNGAGNCRRVPCRSDCKVSRVGGATRLPVATLGKVTPTVQLEVPCT